jgi:hypothetical protein
MQSCWRGSPLHSVVGAILGGLLGYLAFGWIVTQGFYALALPGAAVGIGCGLLSTTRSLLRGILCGVAGLVLGFYSDWSQRPFLADDRFGYYLTHLHQLAPITLILIGLGGLLSFWFGKGYLGNGAEREPEPRESDPQKKASE